MNTARDLASVLAGWQSYRAGVMPPNAHAVQLIECRRAFFAGAGHLYAALIANADLPEAEAMARLSTYSEELQAFASLIQSGET